MTDAQLKALDQCAAAVQRQLNSCADTKTINPNEGLDDEAFCLAIEATCLLQVIAELRGKRLPRIRYA